LGTTVIDFSSLLPPLFGCIHRFQIYATFISAKDAGTKWCSFRCFPRDSLVKLLERVPFSNREEVAVVDGFVFWRYLCFVKAKKRSRDLVVICGSPLVIRLGELGHDSTPDQSSSLFVLSCRCSRAASLSSEEVGIRSRASFSLSSNCFEREDFWPASSFHLSVPASSR
jgi:hypothetical protein